MKRGYFVQHADGRYLGRVRNSVYGWVTERSAAKTFYQLASAVTQARRWNGIVTDKEARRGA